MYTKDVHATEVSSRQDYTRSNEESMQKSFREAKQQAIRNYRKVVEDQVNMGSRWQSTHMEKPCVEPHYPKLYQPVGKKAVGWKTRSNIKISSHEHRERDFIQSKAMDSFDYQVE